MDKIKMDHTDIRILEECDTMEIAESLIDSARENVDFSLYDIDVNQVESALYYLKTVCQNQYNNDYFRHLLAVLVLASGADY